MPASRSAGTATATPSSTSSGHDELRQELRRNRALLEDKIGVRSPRWPTPTDTPAPAYGARYGEAGYRAACAVNNAIAADRHDELAMPRLTVAENTSMSSSGGRSREPACR